MSIVEWKKAQVVEPDSWFQLGSDVGVIRSSPASGSVLSWGVLLEILSFPLLLSFPLSLNIKKKKKWGK